MNNVVYVDDDLVNVTRVRDGKRFTLAWGDPVQIPESGDGDKQVRVLGRGARTFVATYRGTLRTRPDGILRFSMVDVQQGDGMILETPKGRRVFMMAATPDSSPGTPRPAFGTPRPRTPWRWTPWS